MYYYRLISSMLKATVSSLLTSLYAVYKAESNALASLTTNLYAVYKAESNASDSLGLYGGTPQGGLLYTSGISGNQFVFNGTTSAILLTTDQFKFTNDFSFSFWFTPTSISSNYCIFINDSYIAPNEKGYRILQRDSRLELKIFNNTTTVTLITGSVFSVNTTYFCTITHSSTGNEIKINGVSQATDSNGTNAIFENLTQPCIGVNSGIGISAGLYLYAKLDELYVWDRKITSTEITELYNSGSGKFYQGNAFYSTVVNDSLGNYNGTAVGGLTYSAGKSGNAFVFNGTTSYVQLPNNSLNFTSSFTIGWWMNITGNSSDSQQPISNAQRNVVGSTIWGYGVYCQNNIMYFQVMDGTNYVALTCDMTSIFNTWSYVEIEREWNVGSKIRINGSVVASNTSTINPAYRSDVAHTPAIGVYKNTTGTNYFMSINGKIDEVYAWNRLLTTQEKTDIYNAGAGKFHPFT